VKPTVWLGSSKRDLKRFPVGVQRAIGRALQRAQWGETPGNAKVLRGFAGAGVLELVENHDGDTYRAVYTVKLPSAVYVLHVFQKKSKKGSETPMHDLELIHSRLAEAQRVHRGE
jgi:phage-related protein